MVRTEAAGVGVGSRMCPVCGAPSIFGDWARHEPCRRRRRRRRALAVAVISAALLMAAAVGVAVL